MKVNFYNFFREFMVATPVVQQGQAAKTSKPAEPTPVPSTSADPGVKPHPERIARKCNFFDDFSVPICLNFLLIKSGISK